MVKADDILGDSDSGFTKDGIYARKGSVAATIANAVAFEELKKENSEKQETMANELWNDQKDLCPALRLAGLLDFFPIEEWLADTRNEGRIFVSLVILEQFPELKEKCAEKVLQLRSTASPLLIKQIDRLGFSLG